MDKQDTLDKQVQQFHLQIVDLIKKYQFRDRNQICCFGISVSQCYILETLHSYGALTMNELADKMHLSISTVTRVVDQLVKKGYTRREEDVNDRRVRMITITEEGEKIFQKIWDNVIQSEKTILENIPEENRDMLIGFLQNLNQAVLQWQNIYCDC